MPKVSVVIPVYGVERYIERCARSLFEQTLDDIEYLFIDDCSPDQSIDILMRILGEYPNRKSQVVVHRMEQNSGQARVREWGMRNATGEYVIHCDSDDWVDKDMYRLMYDNAVENGSDAVICDYYISNGVGNRVKYGTKSIRKHDIIAGILTNKVAGSLWNKLFSRKLYEHGIVYPVGNMGEDATISLQLLFLSNRVSYISEPLYYYYYNSESITKARSKEKDVSNFKAATDNARIVVDFFEGKESVVEYETELMFFKYSQKQFLFLHLSDGEVYNMWKEAFPEVNKRVYIMKSVPFRYKLFFLYQAIRHTVMC